MESNWTSEQVLRYVDPIQKENEQLKAKVEELEKKDKQDDQQEAYTGPSISEMAEEMNIRNNRR